MVFLKNSQNWKENARIFNSIYFSSRVNISFQLSINQLTFLSLTFFFHIASALFFLFHKSQLCSHKGKFCYIYVIRIKINKRPPRVFQPPSPTSAYYISLNFLTPCLLRPPVYSEPKSTWVAAKLKLWDTFNYRVWDTMRRIWSPEELVHQSCNFT